tara:strand:- start:1176 stop:2387 length:1212 start_codon:yes stop_codon:yes gene_type:complete
MLFRLQKRTLVVSQIIGYALTIFVGITIILVTAQFYFDIKPLLSQQTDMFKSKSAVISKNISVFKTIDKEKIYFTNKEIKELENQSFTKSISKFNSATFKINAYSKKTETIPVFYTDLFFESISDTYLDVETDEWKWEPALDFIPIIIPENYLNLYNFGFAESQGLPVLSKNTISQIEFNIQVSGNHKSKDYKSKIVGFSNKVNSILVPSEFLSWANKEFGNISRNKTSRVLIEFNDPSDKTILEYFNKNNYSINKEKLEFSKLVFFFKSAMFFVFFIALVIIILSISFILLSLNLLIQRNKELLLNLYNIGYNHNRIAKFYQVFISLTTVISIITSLIISNFIRNYYLEKIINLFDFTANKNYILLFGVSLILILIFTYNILIIKNIKKIVIPRDEKRTGTI